MLNYLISNSDIDICSAKDLVACWSDEHNSAITVVTEESTLLFSGNEQVDYTFPLEPEEIERLARRAAAE